MSKKQGSDGGLNDTWFQKENDTPNDARNGNLKAPAHAILEDKNTLLLQSLLRQILPEEHPCGSMFSRWQDM